MLLFVSCEGRVSDQEKDDAKDKAEETAEANELKTVVTDPNKKDGGDDQPKVKVSEFYTWLIKKKVTEEVAQPLGDVFGDVISLADHMMECFQSKATTQKDTPCALTYKDGDSKEINKAFKGGQKTEEDALNLVIEFFQGLDPVALRESLGVAEEASLTLTEKTLGPELTKYYKESGLTPLEITTSYYDWDNEYSDEY